MGLRRPGYLTLAALPAGIALATLLLITTFSRHSEAGEPSVSGATDTLVVNSTSNSDDGDCEGHGNDDIIGGNCTFHEAIDAVNSGEAGRITFDAVQFSNAQPGVIVVDDSRAGSLGCLPAIAVDDVVIDATGRGVVLDGREGSASAPIECPDGALSLHPPHHAVTFTLIGGGNFTIRNFDSNGVGIDCNHFGPQYSLRHLKISGVIFENLTGLDVLVDCATPTATPTVTPAVTATSTPFPADACDVLFPSSFALDNAFCGVIESIQLVAEIPTSDPGAPIVAPDRVVFALLLLDVTNFSGASDDVTGTSLRLRDADGRMFTKDFADSLDAQLAAQEDIGRGGMFDPIAAGETRPLVLVFAVAADATGLTAERCPTAGCDAADTPTPTATATSTRTPTAVPSPTASPEPEMTATMTPGPDQVVGDANCDGEVNSLDAALVLQLHAALLDVFPCGGDGDYDQDGAATSLDAALILQVEAELFPA
jgi:hypothetical protein